VGPAAAARTSTALAAQESLAKVTLAAMDTAEQEQDALVLVAAQVQRDTPQLLQPQVQAATVFPTASTAQQRLVQAVAAVGLQVRTVTSQALVGPAAVERVSALMEPLRLAPQTLVAAVVVVATTQAHQELAALVVRVLSLFVTQSRKVHHGF
jgi:hypothetical protein